MKLYEHGDLTVEDGKYPGNVLLKINATDAIGEEVRPTPFECISERDALELANALTHGKLQALLDAVDRSMADEDGDIFAHLEPILKARKALSP